MNYKYLVIGLLGTVAVFHLGAVSMIIGNQYELTSRDYYAHETDFPELQARINAGHDLSWQHRLIGEGNILEMKVVNPVGESFPLTAVRVELYKPDRAEMDRQLELKLTSSGAWQVDVGELAPGRWRATYEVADGEHKLAWIGELFADRAPEN